MGAVVETVDPRRAPIAASGTEIRNHDGDRLTRSRSGSRGAISSSSELIALSASGAAIGSSSEKGRGSGSGVGISNP